jgi:hypothetical protein
MCSRPAAFRCPDHPTENVPFVVGLGGAMFCSMLFLAFLFWLTGGVAFREDGICLRTSRPQWTCVPLQTKPAK